MIETATNAIAYLLLIRCGTISITKGNKQLVERCLNLSWCRKTTRKNEVEVTQLGLQQIPDFLDRNWSDWRDIEQEVREKSLPLTLESIVELECRKKSEGVLFPRYIHHKTASCIAGIHSKSGAAKPLFADKLKDCTLTTDQVLRIKANKGLVLTAGNELLCDDIMRVLGEVCIPERSFLHGMRVSGEMPRTVFTIENRGAFVDFPVARDDLLLIHCPGNDTPLALRFLCLMPKDISVFHFGDLDSKGLEIASRLKKYIPQNLHLFVPSFWNEYANEKTVGTKNWENCKEDFIQEHPIIANLRQAGRWLEQERILCDCRLIDAIYEVMTKF